MENRTPEEELEYRRYLRKRIRMRKKRRRVMIARAVTLGVIMVFVVFLGFAAGKLVAVISGRNAEPEATATPEPTIQVEIPQGYETVYQELLAMEEEYPEVGDILLNIDSYPIEVLEMLTKNPETLQFVSDYLRYVDDGSVLSGITEQELEEDVPLFLQWDQRWGYVRYGNSVLAISGCGPTCMSMVYTGLKKSGEKNPAVMAEYCLENNYYTAESGTSWEFMLNGARDLGLTAERILVTEEAFREKLEAGSPIICSMEPGDFTDTGHFIVARGITKKGKILFNDPNNRQRSEAKWDMEQVLPQIKAAWAYSVEQQ